MSFEKLVQIRCDHPDCTAATLAAAKAVPLIRRQLRSVGWSYTVTGGDRCRTHTKDTNGEA